MDAEEEQQQQQQQQQSAGAMAALILHASAGHHVVAGHSRSHSATSHTRAAAPGHRSRPFQASRCRCRATQDATESSAAQETQPTANGAPQQAPGTPGARAAAALNAQEQATAAAQATLPKTGYFSLADPTAEVYSRAGETFDPAKKGGRWKPEFIWNTNWQKTLEMQESLQRRRDAVVNGQAAAQPAQAAAARPPPAVNVVRTQAGAIGLSRLADLDRMDVDLTEALKEAARRAAEQQQQQQQQQRRSSSPGVEAGGGRAVPLPRNDLKRLERSTRASRGIVTTVVSTTPEDEAAKAEVAAQELRAYEQEKAEQRLWAAGLSLVGTAATYASYGREVCISYTVGALGGYLYLRLLGRSVDGMAGGSLVAGVASAVGNQRLLIPVILALGYNRWNTLYADDYNVHLNLLAMLVGFLTYKIAVVTRQGKLVMDDIAKGMQRTNE